MASVTFPVAVGGDGSTVSDDSNPSNGLANGGHRTRFVPSLAQIVAIAQYMVSLAQGIPNAMWAPVDGVILTNDTLSGLAARNGVTPTGTQRWLVIGQTTAAQNGLYTPASGAWTRTTDADIAADFAQGKLVAVREGTVGADSLYMFTTAGAITLGTTSLTFIPLPSFNNANTWTASQTFAAALLMSNAAINESMGADIASAATVNLDTATGNVVQVTGTTAITTITLSAGRRRTVRFTGALTLTNGASLALPGGANITTAVGDFADFVGYAGGVVRCVRYQEIGGRPLLSNGDTMTGELAMSGAAINEAQGADIASAATINLDTATGNLVDVTGTTAINAITLSQGRERTVRFTGALTLKNGANLVLPGGANITTAAGDFAIFRGYSGPLVRCVSYTRATTRIGSGPVVVAAGLINTAGDTTITVPAGSFKKLTLNIVGLTATADFCPYLRFNGDTAANYQVQSFYADAGSVNGSTSTAQTAINIGYAPAGSAAFDDTPTSIQPMNSVLVLHNPAVAAGYKQITLGPNLQRNNVGGGNAVFMSAASWNVQNAITSLLLLLRSTGGGSPGGTPINATGGEWFLTGELGVL